MPKQDGPLCDKFGIEISPGDTLLYPCGFSSHSVNIRVGKVVKIQNDSVFVRGIDDNWRSGKLRLTGRAGVLSNPQRTVIIPNTFPDTDYQDLLSEIVVAS